MMEKLSREELKKILQTRVPGVNLELRGRLFENLDLSGWNLSDIDFSKCDFRNVRLDEADMSGVRAENTFFGGSSLHKTNLQNAILRSADLRGCNLSEADIRGADMFASALYRADLTGINADDTTKFFHLYCPEEGPFIGWKVCYGRRIVQLLVPADARRISGTTNEVKCDKAKVLTIKSVDFTQKYEAAHSYVDENFIYRTGEMVYAENFNPDRFAESGGGIHIWLTREEAIAYLG